MLLHRDTSIFKQWSDKKKEFSKLALALVGLSCIGSSPALASIDKSNNSASVQAEGDVKAQNKQDKRYFFDLSGVMRFDGAIFSGSEEDIQGNYPSGARIKTAEWSLKGGVGNDWSYLLRMRLDEGRARFPDAALMYKGIAPNVLFGVGRLSSSFSLDNENSTSWQPLIDAASTNAFLPNAGLGMKYSMWWENHSFKITALQPERGSIRPPVNSGTDPWQFSARGVYAPIHEKDDVLHLGLGGVFRQVDYQNNGGGPIKRLIINVYPCARARNTASLVRLVEPGLRTGGDTSDVGMQAKSSSQFNLEFARQHGPFLFFTEYFHMYVKRPPINPVTNLPRKNVQFHGWYAETSWLITGESRQYSVKDGSFNEIVPANPTIGAWEVAARYGFVNVNDRDIQGGSQHDFTLGVNWFFSKHLRISANYIRALVHPAVIYAEPSPRKLNIFSARAQIRW